VPYAATLTASGVGTPYSWSIVSGALPPGLILNTGTGGVSGIPTQIGSFKFMVQLFVSSSPSFKAATGSIGLNVDSPSPQITTSVLPNSQVGVQFQASLTAAGGVQPYVWSVISGTLPSGLSLNAASGMLSGTPSQGGQFDFSVQVSDSSSPKPLTAMKALTLTVLAFALQINSYGLPNGEVGAPFQALLTGSGGVTPYTWSVTGALPAGLSLNASTGAIAGTPTQNGTSTFTIVLTDATAQTAQKSLSIMIVPAGVQPLAISTTSLAQPTVGTAYAVILQATGGTPPYAWMLPAISGQLPPGLALNFSTGQIAGTPTSAGPYSFTVQVQDSGPPLQTASQAFSVTASAASSLDQYGGDASHACAGTMKNGNPIPGATGFFYLYKDTNLKHWMFCDPLGNRFFLQDVQVIDSGYNGGSVNIAAKYGNGLYDYFSRQTIRLQDLGFNGIGEYAHLRMLPVATQSGTGNPNKMPFVYLENVTARALTTPDLTRNVKSLVPNLPPSYTGYKGGDLPDVFSPNWITNLNFIYSASDPDFPSGGTPAALDASAWMIATVPDDTDHLFGVKDGPTTSHAHIGWMTGVAPPYMNCELIYSVPQAQCYADPVFYLKNQLQIYLTAKYATVGALNTAWGSSYTTLGSSATTVTNETIGTGDGATTSFSHTFAHGIVDPASIGISIGGTLGAGDCPWFNPYAPCFAEAAGQGALTWIDTGISGGIVKYAPGGPACGGQAAPCITITFSVPPATGVAIAATYQYGGWPKATAGGTGLLDEDGTSGWYPADSRLTPPIVGSIATDLDGFFTAVMTQYYSTINTRFKAALPHHLVFGPDAINITARPQVFSQASGYMDAMEVANIQPTAPGAQALVTSIYNTTPVPFIPYHVAVANPDSSLSASSCHGWDPDCFVTQAARGAGYQTYTQQWFNNYVGADSYGFITGMDWWQYVDRNNELENFGLVSLDDNLYNGIESCGKSVTDQWGFTTTPEPTTGCFGDFITPVKAANRIWLIAP
jgi:hypothetical protein